MTERAPAIGGMPIADVYTRYARDVFGYVFHLTRDRSLGEDLTSETFARALQYRNTFQDRGKPIGAWLVTIARNLVRDHNRSAYQRTTVLCGWCPADDVPLEPEDRGNPERAALQHEDTARLVSAMRRLPPAQRECIYFRFFAGRSVAETASLLRKNEPAVRALQYRAARSLRALLQNAATIDHHVPATTAMSAAYHRVQPILLSADVEDVAPAIKGGNRAC